MGLYSNPYGGGGGRSSRKVYKPEPLGGGSGNLDIDTPDKPNPNAGKFAVDLTNPGKSIVDTAGSVAEFGSNLVGGIAGAIGSLGPDGETASIGQAFEDIGRIPGGIGDFKRPWDADDATAPTLGQAAGMGIGAAYDPIYRAQQGVLERIAEARALDYQKGTGQGRNDLPPDLQRRLDEGESVDVLADELLARGQSVSSDPGAQLAGEIVMDPLNLIAPGVGKGLQAARAASMAVRSADDLAQLGIAQRTIGQMYNAASRGMSAGGQRLVDATLGPSTSGVFHTLGTAPYKTLRADLGRLSVEYAQAFENSFAIGAAQLPRAVIGNQLADEANMLLREFGEDALERLPDNLEATVANRLRAVRTIAPDAIERRSQELLARVAPDFATMPADDLAAMTARKLASITGMSPEDAARLLGPNVDRATARTIHLAAYGKAGDDLARAKARIPRFSTSGIDAGRLTLIAPDTLTVERAERILDGTEPLVDAVERYGILANRFGNKPGYDHGEVRAFIERLTKEGALPSAVRLPTTGAHKLPKSLSAWRAKYADDYELGFAPEDGWKTVTDADGTVVMADPFVTFTSEADPVTMRNPLGRLVDALFRGTTQTAIVQESRQRFVDEIVKHGLPVSPNQARSIHRAILEEAFKRGESPRSLVVDSVVVDGEKVGTIDEIFRRHLTPDEHKAVTQKADPAFLFLRAMEGNWRTVGLTQKLTGAVKSKPVIGKGVVGVAERLFPAAKFRYNTFHQTQELVESPFFNALRGVIDRPVDPDVAKVYRQLVELPELRYLSEAGYVLDLSGGKAVERFVGLNTPIGRAMARFANVAERKSAARIRQVLSEHGESFRDGVQTINPKFWQRMTEAYGTSDPRVIADRFLAERWSIGPGENIDEAMDAFDAATRRAFADDATSQTVWAAWRATFEETSRAAFKTHFFTPQRGWLERTLNHPLLGLYPLSYQAKVASEFARFMLRRPFGLDAPLVGGLAVTRIQQAFLGALAEDPEFRAWAEEHEDAAYFLANLVPGTPASLGFGAPAWLRHVAQDAAAGRDISVATVGRELQDTGSYHFGRPISGPVQMAEGVADLGGIASDIFSTLDRAAAEYDGQFGPPLQGTPLTP